MSVQIYCKNVCYKVDCEYLESWKQLGVAYSSEILF